MQAPSTNDHQAHEDKCRRCGRCCYHKLLVGDTVVYTDSPCPYLDVDTNLCTVYDRRHEVNPDCLDVAKGIERGVFPADCPYVVDLPDYRPPVEDPAPDLLGELIASLDAEETDT
jgi:uncharacterized cysteine cluster protein YcgN (CxxCxxCC family)